MSTLAKVCETMTRRSPPNPGPSCADRPVIPREAVGDRDQQAHEANLYDVDAKYGDVVSVEDTLEYLEKVREGTGAPK